MKALTIDVHEATGRILNSTVFRSGGKKLLAKGHLISEDDIRLLEVEGLDRINIAELEDGEVGEDDAVLQVAGELGLGCFEIRLAAGGRANLVATEDCCVLVDDDILRQINCTASIVVATMANFAYARAGQRIATVKSAPFAISSDQLEAVVAIIRDRGALIQARPIRQPLVAVIYSDPLQAEKARQLFEPITQQRLEHFGTQARIAMHCIEDERLLAKTLQHVLRSKPTVVLFASTTAPAGPNDPIGLAMQLSGCSIERFLAPVEPGNLLLLGYKDEIPVVSAPGCFRSAKANVVDLILPPLLARYRVSGWELAALGHGGLLA
jgi:molybdenum cofactor cytidylyltransferase